MALVVSSDVTLTIQLDWERIPPVGVFDVKVTGPLGRGTSRRLTIARDLHVSPDVPFRPMSALGTGLTEASMDLSYFGGNAVTVTLAPQEADTIVKLAVGEDEVSVRCAIPAMSVTALGREERPPSHSPVNLDLEDLLILDLQLDTLFKAQIGAAALHSDGVGGSEQLEYGRARLIEKDGAHSGARGNLPGLGPCRQAQSHDQSGCYVIYLHSSSFHAGL